VLPGRTKEQIAVGVPDYPPFRIDLDGVEIFPVTKVIYLGVRSGNADLRRMHDSLNDRALSFDEPYSYHPHVTLAQGLHPDHVDEAFELATARWREFQHSRSFQVETLTFVQNTTANQWLDLVEYELGSLAAVRR
jgi:2'-5' RNA ligase